MTPAPDNRPAGHVLVPAAAIGSLAMLLACGLGALGMLGRIDGQLARIITRDPAPDFAKHLPWWAIWLVTALVAYGLPAVMLAVAGPWRRWILWISTLVIIGGWAPVLVLAAREPQVSGPFVAGLWSGMCALVYAGNHRMAVDRLEYLTGHGTR